MGTNQNSRSSQRSQTLGLLVRARGAWVPLPEILKVGGAQFGARLFEIRHELGFNVQNRKERHSGQTHSWYRLVLGPTMPTTPIAPACQDSLFPELTPRHIDNG